MRPFILLVWCVRCYAGPKNIHIYMYVYIYIHIPYIHIPVCACNFMLFVQYIHVSRTIMQHAITYSWVCVYVSSPFETCICIYTHTVGSLCIYTYTSVYVLICMSWLISYKQIYNTALYSILFYSILFCSILFYYVILCPTAYTLMGSTICKASGDQGFGSRIPDSVRDVCALD